MATKTITAVASALMLVAACAGGAHAGHGGNGFGGAPLGGFLLECYNINSGAKSGTVLELNDQFTNPTQYTVGTAQLLCTPADADVLGGPFTVFPNQTALEDADHIVCYQAQAAQAIESGIVVDLQDPLSPGNTQRVKVASTRYVCVQAIKTCVSGCPVTGQ